MKALHFVALGAVCGLSIARADVHRLRGSDTLAGLVGGAIDKAGLSDDLRYDGGGSGEGEKALARKEQGLAPMSREISPKVVEQMQAQGINVAGHVIALDGVCVFANAKNTIAGMDIATLKKIFECQITDWKDVPSSGRTGVIRAFRRNDSSGTTDTFKSLVGISKFGACVEVVAETEDIKHHTGSKEDAIGYAGLSGKGDKNRAVPLAKVAGDSSVAPSVDTIRAFTYPLSRRLYVYEATGGFKPNEVEQELLDVITDLREMKSLVKAHDFVPLID